MIKNGFLAKNEFKSDIMCSLRSLLTESTIVKGLIFIFLLLFFINIVSSNKVQFKEIKHKTKEASEKVNELYCYSCDYLENGENCENINKTKSSNLTKKCQTGTPDQEENFCVVKRFSYTTSTENTTSNRKLWSLQRSCSTNCESGCIIIGERTKLYACTACCNTTLCNVSANANINQSNQLLQIFLQTFVFAILIKTVLAKYS